MKFGIKIIILGGTMQITGLAIFTVCFSLIVLSMLVGIYEQVKRNQSYIELLLEQHRQDTAERKRKERIKEWSSYVSSST